MNTTALNSNAEVSPLRIAGLSVAELREEAQNFLVICDQMCQTLHTTNGLLTKIVDKLEVHEHKCRPANRFDGCFNLWRRS